MKIIESGMDTRKDKDGSKKAGKCEDLASNRLYCQHHLQSNMVRKYEEYCNIFHNKYHIYTCSEPNTIKIYHGG